MTSDVETPIVAAEAGTPVFQMLLGADWRELGEIIRRHYFLRTYSDDQISVVGIMDEVHSSRIARLVIPLTRLFGSLVPYQGTDVPIVVHYSARPDADTIHWDRVFDFPGRKPFHFRSYMEPCGDHQVIEFVRFGVGMKLRVTAEGGALVFRDVGYVWRLFGVDVPLPVGLLLGKAYVEERPLDGERFTMKMSLRHPLFGELFRYSGTFSIGADQAPSSGTPSLSPAISPAGGGRRARA